MLLLGGCGTSPEQSDSQPDAVLSTDTAEGAASGGETDTTASAAAHLSLDPEGLRIFLAGSGASRPLPFDTPAETVLTALAATRLGAPDEQGSNLECAAEYASWDGNFTAWFSDGRFIGWFLRDDPAITTPAGVGIGSTRAELEAAHQGEVMDSSLGVEFYSGGLAGLLSSAAPDGMIEALWSGFACIAR